MSAVTQCPGGPRTNPDCEADVHGNYAAYRHAKCRCVEAREAWRLYYKRRREGRAQARRVDSTGTVRRLRALATLGYSWREVAAKTTVSAQQIGDLAGAEPPPAVHIHTHRAVAKVYAELSDTPAPDGYAASRARGLASRRGFAPPAAWDDETIDDPQVRYDPNGGKDIIDEVAIRRVVDGEARYGDLRLPERKALVQTYAHRIPGLPRVIGMSGAQYRKWVDEMEAA